MKNKILLISVMVISGSCSSIYRSGQTPDDVYYSPAREIKSAPDQTADEYQPYTSSSEDNYLRMKVQNHYMWSSLDDYDYWNDSRYDFGYSCTPSRDALIYGYNPYINYGWNNTLYFGYNNYGGGWYNPYSTIVYYKNPGAYYHSPQIYGTISKSNLQTYYNNTYNNTNTNTNNSNANNRSFGSLIKQVFSNNTSSNNNNNNTWNQPARTFNSNSNSTPSSSSGGHSGGFNSTGSSSSGGRPGH